MHQTTPKVLEVIPFSCYLQLTGNTKSDLKPLFQREPLFSFFFSNSMNSASHLSIRKATGGTKNKHINLSFISTTNGVKMNLNNGLFVNGSKPNKVSAYLNPISVRLNLFQCQF